MDKKHKRITEEFKLIYDLPKYESEECEFECELEENETEHDNERASTTQTSIIQTRAESIQTNTSTTSYTTSWMWKIFFKEYNDRNVVIALVCSICKASYKPSNIVDTLAKHIQNKHPNKVEKQQSILEKFASKPYSTQNK